MKKFFTMAVMSLAVLAVSCNKEDQPQETPKEVVSIEGTWVFESLTSEDKSKMVPPNACQKKWSFTFSQDKFNLVSYPIGNSISDCENRVESTSTYIISDNKIITKTDDGNELDSMNFTLDKTTLTLKLKEGAILVLKRKN